MAKDKLRVLKSAAAEDKDAYVVKKKGASVTEDSIKSAVKSNLARYKVPREVEFIDELPRNATGKVLKRELRERFPDA